MGKFLFWALLIVLGLYWYKRLSNPASQRRDAAHKQPSTAADAAEKIVQCTQCRVYLPQAETVVDNGRIRCRDSGQCRHRK